MGILDRIRQWAAPEDPDLATDRMGAPISIQLRDAAVALLLEAAHGDAQLTDDERAAVYRGIEARFGVSEEEAASFIDSAAGSRPPLKSLQDLIDEVRRGYDREQKLELLSLLWTVVAADERITEWESVFADHVAAAVGLSPVEWKEAKALASD